MGPGARRGRRGRCSPVSRARFRIRGAAGSAAAAAALLSLVLLPGSSSAQVFLTQDEALRLAFPEPASIERRTAFLDEGQVESARRRAGGDVTIEQTVVTYYVGFLDGEPLGVAYFDAHRVRTMREVVMFEVSPAGAIESVEILKFAEPQEYLASEPWLEQLEGRELDDELAVDRGIVNLTGATLTSGALTRAARRVLALHSVVRPLDGPAGR